MLGYGRDEYVGRKFWEIDAFKDRDTGRATFRELQENEFVLSENLALTTKDGRQIQVEFVGNAYRVGDEQIIQATFRDINERKRADAALQAKEEARLSLIENLEDHWLLIENLPVGIVVHDHDTRIVLSNSEASKLLGMSSVQLLGKQAGDPDWHFVREDGSRLPVEEFPVSRVIARRPGRVWNAAMQIPVAPDTAAK
jgi:PAS domain-containing protein